MISRLLGGVGQEAGRNIVNLAVACPLIGAEMPSSHRQLIILLSTRYISCNQIHG